MQKKNFAHVAICMFALLLLLFGGVGGASNGIANTAKALAVNVGGHSTMDTVVDVARDVASGGSLTLEGVAASFTTNLVMEAITGGAASPGVGKAAKEGLEGIKVPKLSGSPSAGAVENIARDAKESSLHLSAPEPHIVSAAPVQEEVVDLYRAVGVREYESIRANKAFLPGSNSLEGRQFAFSEEEALKYADIDLSKVAIVKTSIPKEILNVLDYSKTIDPYIFKNGVVTVHPEINAVFNHSLIDIEMVL